MNKIEFLRQLENEISKLPQQEVRDIIEYYREYFDEAGEESEGNVLRELGAPSKIAAQIKADWAVKEMNEAPTVKKGISTVWIVIGAIFAAPIALPIAVTILAAVFGILVAVVAVAVSAIIAVIACFFGGIAAIVVGIIGITASVPVAIFSIGTGVLVAGISALTAIVVVLAFRGTLHIIANLVNRGRNKSKKEPLHFERKGEDHE